MAPAEASSQPTSIATGPGADATAVVLVVETAIDAVCAGALAERLRVLSRSGSQLVVCDVRVIVDPDITTVDALARMALAARRVGCRLRLRHACPELRGLLALAGLADVLPCGPESVVEMRGQPEQREELRRVQEERDPADPIA